MRRQALRRSVGGLAAPEAQAAVDQQPAQPCRGAARSAHRRDRDQGRACRGRADLARQGQHGAPGPVQDRDGARLAKARGYRQGDNPARWRGHLKTLLPKAGLVSRNYPAMSVDAVPDFVARLRRKQAITARALEFLILTAARSAEVTGMLWDEVDLRNRVWTIPGSRMKRGREHRVPLSAHAVAILSGLKRDRKSVV